MKDDPPEVSRQLKPVQGYKSGSGTTGFVCLLAVLGIELAVLGIELGLPNAKDTISGLQRAFQLLQFRELEGQT